jgi:hypothetical protein
MVLPRVGLRRAVLAVRTAALTPDAGVKPEELVALVQKAAQADIPDWEYRELLGAALYRAGKAEEAAAELQKAVQQHGKSGSTWARLWLALADRKLGKATESAAWRPNAQPPQTSDWKERLVYKQLSAELDALPSPRP